MKNSTKIINRDHNNFFVTRKELVKSYKEVTSSDAFRHLQTTYPIINPTICQWKESLETFKRNFQTSSDFLSSLHKEFKQILLFFGEQQSKIQVQQSEILEQKNNLEQLNAENLRLKGHLEN